MKALKDAIEHHYGLKVKKLKVIKEQDESSFVAKVVTDKGNYAIKNLYLSPERQRFIAETEVRLAERKVPLAEPVRTLDKKLYFEHDSFPFVLYEWLKGPPQSLANISRLEESVRAIARFHKASKGLKYPSVIKISSHVHWYEEYEQRLNALKKWKKKNRDASDRRKKEILRYIPNFYKAAKRAQMELHHSSYEKIKQYPFSRQTLVHGDMHQNNFIRQGGRLFMIDFEDVRYDLPSKDLIRLFSMYTSRHFFSKRAFDRMIKAYLKVRSLSPQEKKLLLIDFMFPHVVERMLRKNLYRKWSLTRVKHFLKQEQNKVKHVKKKLRSWMLL